MKNYLSEGKFLLYSVLAIFFLMSTHIFQEQINSLYNPENYVGFHTMLENISICISATIFFYGLKRYRITRSSQMLLLSFTFFFIGTMDLFHTLTFKGMPYFITESSVAKATWFWIIARSGQAILLLPILLLPDWSLKRDYRIGMLAVAAVLLSVIIYVVFYFENSLPLLMEDGKGTTPLKNAIEYSISVLQFICLLITLYHYHEEKCEAKLSIALALVFLLLAELVFTIYRSVYDIDNFVGHIFKTLGFYYILKGFYFLKNIETMGRQTQRKEPEYQTISQQKSRTSEVS